MKNVPDFLYEMLILQYGIDLTKKILQGYNSDRKTTLRVNTSKISVQEVKEILTRENIKYNCVNWYCDALIIEDDKNIKKLDIYNNGEVYMQSLSSMIPALILDPCKNEKILDMAAAPGGKTTQIYNLSNGEALITAVEKNKIRADRLKYNIFKQGANMVSILMEDARSLDEFFSFDKILLDAPCSGSGTLNINNNSLNFFNKDLVDRSIKTQKDLLNKAVQVLKKGHEMVYSTCSILREENEEQLLSLINKNKIEIVPIDKELFKDIPMLPTIIDGVMCICPSDLYEGFFVAKIKKICD